ncbi:facilitated trehalose transporter Tret1-like isoform X2 [Leptidea sinapis]|uniref:facilitated trehalose transporter Tret1-like isoform X2 n=1 Tax=Leptidea sinapis TaxID=189913 RepID=UPI0021C2590D|nr:facilitated trehalose transporter Tret1-like isoform X2 [Leptidea sinapis]
MSVINQVIATGIVSYLCMMMGVMFTWPASVLELFGSQNTTLNRVMTETELSLLSSLASVSGLLSVPFSGPVLDRLGRKYTCVLFSLLQVIAWTIIASSNNVYAVLSSVFICGITSCTLLVLPLYIGEFCQESIRGAMGSAVIMFFGIGILVSYMLGGLVKYQIMNYICLAMSVLGTVMLSYLKESPLILIKWGMDDEAAKNIAFFRGVKVNSVEVHTEMENIRRALNPELDDATPEEEKLKPQLDSPKLSIWQFMKKSRSTRRALLVCLVLCSATAFQGVIAVQVYAVPIFALAMPTISPTLCSVIFGIVTVISGVFAVYLVESLGRKSLMVYMSLGSAVFCVLLGTQIQLSWGPQWISAVFIYLFTITYTIGAGTVPYVYVAEVFLPEIKGFTSMLAMEWMFLGAFIILYIYTPLVNSIVCLATTVFCAIWMPETKGLTVDVIQQKFATPKYISSKR